MEKTYKFELPQNKEVESTKVRIEDGKVLVDVEFKEKYQFKLGDIVVIENPECQDYKRDYIISIYPDKETPKGYTLDFFDIVCIDMDGKIRINPHTPYIHRNVHLADASDKKELFDKLAEIGKTWNAEKKILEDIYIPKFGDIVRIEHPDTIKYKRQHVISIFPNKEVPTKSVSGFFDIATIDMNGNIRVGDEAHSYYNHGFVKKASETEKQELFSKLAEVGKRWNAETKQLEDIRWRAEKGEVFHYVSGSLEVLSLQDSRGRVSDGMYKVGNYFRTPEAAKKVADQIKDIFKNSKVE